MGFLDFSPHAGSYFRACGIPALHQFRRERWPEDAAVKQAVN
jgi:hypothetical protein